MEASSITRPSSGTPAPAKVAPRGRSSLTMIGSPVPASVPRMCGLMLTVLFSCNFRREGNSSLQKGGGRNGLPLFSLATIERAEAQSPFLTARFMAPTFAMFLTWGRLRDMYACTGSFSSEELTRFDGASQGGTQGATGAESMI